MLAFVLIVIQCVELLLYATVGTVLWAKMAWPVWLLVVCAIGCAFLIRLSLIVFMFGISWRYRSPRPPGMRLGPFQSVQLVGSEWAVLVLLYGLLHPAEILMRPRYGSADVHSVYPPVLFIHGFFCNGGYWFAMIRFLRRQGVRALYTINCEPIHGSIEFFAKQVSTRVDVIRQRTGADRVILIGHSMGGLIARTYVQRYGGAKRVARIITLGSPHQGTEHARFAHGEDARQMRPGSAWLDALNSEAPKPVPVTSIYTMHDNIVAPQNSAELSFAKNIPLHGIGHLAMAFHPQVQALVYQEIAGATHE